MSTKRVMGNAESSQSKVRFNDRVKELLSSRKTYSSSFVLLIPEIVLNIMGYLPTHDLCRLSRVCRLWYDLHSYPSLMKTITFARAKTLGDREIKRFVINYGKKMCSQVVSLNLNRTCVSAKQLIKVIKFVPNLTKLKISSQSVSCESIRAICENLKHLKCLKIKNSTCLHNHDFYVIGQLLPFLEELDISGCTSLTDKTMVHIALYMQNLRVFKMRRCTGLTDGGLEQVLRHCKLLKSLDVSNVPVLSYPTIMAMSKYAKNLVSVRAIGTSLSEFGFRLLMQNAPLHFTIRCDLVCQGEKLCFGELKMTRI